MGEIWSKYLKGSNKEETDDTPYPFQAVTEGNVAKVENYCKNSPTPVSKLLYHGTTLLHYAVNCQELDCVRVLLKYGDFDVNVKDYQENTPLVEIIYRQPEHIENAEEIIKLLLKHKADINARSFVGRRILLRAFVFRNYDVALLLLKHGADPNMCDYDGMVPIHVCASYNQLDLMERLISYGADINRQDNNGRTALYFATLYGHQDIFNSLLSKRCNPNIGSKSHGYPLQVAIEKCKPEFVERLLKYGTVVNTDIKECRSGSYYDVHDYLNIALLFLYIQYDSYRIRDNGKPNLFENFVGSIKILDLVTQAVCVKNDFSKNQFFRSCWLPLKLPEFLPYNHILRRIVTRLALMHELNFSSKLQTALPVVDAEVNKFSLKMICVRQLRQYICNNCSTNVIYAVENLNVDFPKYLKNLLLLKDI